MIVNTSKFAKCIFFNTLKSFHTTTALKKPGAYEGEGKTTLHIMNKDEELGLMINGYSEVGFRLNNNITILGPMIIFPRSVLSWNIENVSDITENSLSLFKILEPKIDIIVIGTGDKIDNHNILKSLLPFSKKYKVSFEVLPTESACPTFNFLNAENRNVVGAMLPPQQFTTSEDDELQSKLRYQRLYEQKWFKD